MIGVDTTVVVSLFIADDRNQQNIAKTVFRERHEDGPVFICAAVLLESVWTLKTLYGYEDNAMKRMLAGLCSLPNTVVEHMDAVFEYANDEETDIDLADAIIAAASAKNGCTKTLTFDKRSARNILGMELMS